MFDPKVACIIPTYNGKHDLNRLLDSLQFQTANFDLIIVDSNSSDGTAELAKSRCPNVLSVDSSAFNHGGTRQLVVELNPGYDIYILMTQDAYLEDSYALDKIIAPFADDGIAAVCGRQLPHLDANPLASHARFFNYDSQTIVKSIGDAPIFGIKTPFMSNSFSAYRGVALNSSGGFPSHVILSEDMYVGAKMLLNGWKIAYAGDACCRHSHNYSITEEFQRYFDIGVFHAREPWIRKTFGGAGGEGFRYVKSELKFLGIAHIHLWPSALIRNIFKLLAYKLGQHEKKIPPRFKKKLGMYKRYWDSPFRNS